MTRDIFRIQTRLFQKDGLTLIVGKLVPKKHGFHFNMDHEVVLESRICTFGIVSDDSLALMEMRISLARLIWHFDITLKDGQTEPAYDHITISAGKLAVRITPRYN